MSKEVVFSDAGITVKDFVQTKEFNAMLIRSQQIPLKVLYIAYCAWCRANKKEVAGNRSFTSNMTKYLEMIGMKKTTCRRYVKNMIDQDRYYQKPFEQFFNYKDENKILELKEQNARVITYEKQF